MHPAVRSDKPGTAPCCGMALERMEAFGVPRRIVPDNLKSGVHKASFYDPEINRSYGKMAAHYAVGILPARPRRPKDKAKVENGVLVVTRWVLARLRHQRFFSLNELNRALRTLLTDLNQRPFKKLPGCRASAFAEMDQPALRALPLQPYEYAQWKLARVGIDERKTRYLGIEIPLVRVIREGMDRGAPIAGGREHRQIAIPCPYEP